MLALRRRRREPPQPPPQFSDLTPERLGKTAGDYTVGGDARANVRIVTMQDAPLERALRRGAITERQYTAGTKYRHHWYRAGMAGSMQSLNLDRVFAADVSGFSHMPKDEAQAFHRQQYRAAVRETGEVGSQVLEWVIGLEKPLDAFGHALGWEGRAQAIAATTERLKAALDLLCKLWGVS